MNQKERIQKMLASFNAIRLYVRTYPRSGTHLIGSILHYRYGFSPMSPTFVKPTIKGQNDPLQYFTFHYNQTEVFPEQIPDIYVLRNPFDCISSQYYRGGGWTIDSIKEEDRLAYKNAEMPTDYKRPGFHCNTVFNEIGKFNQMLSCIKDTDLVLYYEDLFENPDKWLKMLDIFLKKKYDVDPVDTKISIEEIKAITLKWYNDAHRAMDAFSEGEQNKFKSIKAEIKPYINKFLDKSNKHIKGYD
tara:strand:- start:464 stop:1198 length:735 start_codon:yes stop_codon:yes gene_type:complete